ncbi:MAG: isoleucine--tRNA ligase [Oscillospiraceae bacterium]|jgi:isoleucyl-tRNA synthetase|nr:isoleucine--tRNA ligase [Oscillospiraceae bacterium]
MTDYNATLNLPKTDFPMRAGLPKREPPMLEEWEAKQLYDKIIRNGTGKPRFVLHDGPPFSNGAIHMGHTLNKLIKDFIIRYKNISGWQAPYTPGWDTHGMPIETAIIKKNRLDRHAMSVIEFRDACSEFARGYIDIQREGFKRLGVIGDWDQPYATLLPSFEAREVKIFGEMFKKGYIYKGLKPVYWCPSDETSLAEAEIEYAEDKCTSVYVKFKIADDKGKLAGAADLNSTYFVIWTTTPWTIPGNLAICLNPEFEYALAKVPNGETYIIAKDRLDKVPNCDGAVVLATFKGSELELMTAKHPLYDRESLIITGRHVTLESGTGCVHTAPGHGMDDFIAGKKYDLPILVPVDSRGIMTAEAGEFAGQHYSKANNAIIERLADAGAMLSTEEMTHKYPHCWRCRNPIIFRATEQWFCSVEAFSAAAIAACDTVEWLNDWGRDRMVSMIRERSDWCISRQRNWGLPIPVFYCDNCGEVICEDDTIETVSDAFGKYGSNAWYDLRVEELLPNGFKCPKCGGTHFTREKDTLDCWFDSGSTWFASDYLRTDDDVAHMYLEGGDQYRGWFQSSLLTSIAVRGKAPYKSVLTNGWVLDKAGHSMHKSLGNVIDPSDIIKQYGADVMRLWVASVDYRTDVRVSDELFKQLSDSYLKIRNTARFILGNLAGFDPDQSFEFEKLTLLDRWAVSKLNELIGKVRAAYEKYEFHIVYHAIHNFCVVDMSNFYLDVLKDILYCEKGERRKSAQTAIWTILDALTRTLAPLLAFTTEEIWQIMPHKASDNPESVMLNDIPSVNADIGVDETAWAEFFVIREQVLKLLEEARADKRIGKALDAEVTIPNAPFDAEQMKLLLNVSKVTIGGEMKIQASEAPKCPRCWTHSYEIGKVHAELCPRCAAEIGEK